MTKRLFPSFILMLLMLASLRCAPQKKPSESAGPQLEVHELISANTSPTETCSAPYQLLAAKTVERTPGPPTEANLPFSIPEDLALASGNTTKLCVQVTNLRDKPHRVSSATFTLDGIPVIEPSAFNQNVASVATTTTAAAGDHLLHARVVSTPGALISVLVYGLLPDTLTLTDGALNAASAVLTPAMPTVLSLPGATFTFPEGTVRAPVEVTVAEYLQPVSLSNLFHLLPTGLILDKPVTVELKYDANALPPEESEATLTNDGMIRVRHDETILDTQVDADEHLARASIDHLSRVEVILLRTRLFKSPGIIREVDDVRNVILAYAPAGNAAYTVHILSEKFDESLDGLNRPALILKQVTEHVQPLSATERVAINLSIWSPNIADHVQDHGNNIPGEIGVGRPQWSFGPFTNVTGAGSDARYHRRVSCTSNADCEAGAECGPDGLQEPEKVCLDEYFLAFSNSPKSGISTAALTKEGFGKALASPEPPPFSLMAASTMYIHLRVC